MILIRVIVLAMPARRLRSAFVFALALSVAVALTSCGDNDAPSTGTPVVAASFAPVEEILRNVGGDLVQVVSIVPPGEEAHEYEPTAKDLQPLERARFVAFIGGGFQEGVEKAVDGLPDGVRRIDLLDGLELIPVGQEIGVSTDDAAHDHGGPDPHVWLDPSRMVQMATAVAGAMKDLGLDAGRVDSNLAAYTSALESLDDRLAAGLAECDSRLLVTGHHAFGYLAAAYGLEQVAVAGISPSDEPSAATLQQVADFAAGNGVSTIFFEENLPADLARTVAEEIGATTAVLDPVESLSDDQRAAGASYVSLMDQNLAAMREGLGCR
jgi:zinc transport system substrate-binding protein